MYLHNFEVREGLKEDSLLLNMSPFRKKKLIMVTMIIIINNQTSVQTHVKHMWNILLQVAPAILSQTSLCLFIYNFTNMFVIYEGCSKIRGHMLPFPQFLTERRATFT